MLSGRSGRGVLLMAHQGHKVAKVVVAVLSVVASTAAAAVTAVMTSVSFVAAGVAVGQAVVVHLAVVGTWGQMLGWQTCKEKKNSRKIRKAFVDELLKVSIDRIFW